MLSLSQNDGKKSKGKHTNHRPPATATYAWMRASALEIAVTLT